MAATLFTLVLPKPTAEQVFALLGHVFEEAGLPVAMREVEEDGPLSEIAVYADTDADEVASDINTALRQNGIEIAVSRKELPDIDWVAHSLEGLKPVRAGRFLVHGSHDRAQRKTGDLAIEIEAGQAFGTGHHGTTAGCLEAIGRILRSQRPRNALDVGTGSAVLAIAVAKLARIPVLATDIDPVAVKVAAQNVRLNGETAFIAARQANGFSADVIRSAAPFDLIVANILARPLMRLAPAFAHHIAPGGSVILSGILARQRWSVISAFAAQRFRHARTTTLDNWVTIHLQR